MSLYCVIPDGSIRGSAGDGLYKYCALSFIYFLSLVVSSQATGRQTEFIHEEEEKRDRQ
jgi:hypothetical protein